MKSPPELSVFADGHHDQQVSQDAHQHDQRQEADQGHPLWHAVAAEGRNKEKTLFQTSAFKNANNALVCGVGFDTNSQQIDPKRKKT